MSLLTAADLAYMDATQREAMPGTVVIERNTLADNGMGGSYEGWNAIGTVIGRIYPKAIPGGSEMMAGAQETSLVRWAGSFPLGTDVLANDRLFYGSRTWEVISTNNDEMWQTDVRCELESMNEERRV